MKVGAFDAITQVLDPKKRDFIDNGSKQGGFMDYLQKALGEVDALQKDTTINVDKLLLGDENYLHTTMIAYEKANLALQLTIEIRNKLLEAYQEIMRMQV